MSVNTFRDLINAIDNLENFDNCKKLISDYQQLLCKYSCSQSIEYYLCDWLVNVKKLQKYHCFMTWIIYYAYVNKLIDTNEIYVEKCYDVYHNLCCNEDYSIFSKCFDKHYDEDEDRASIITQCYKLASVTVKINKQLTKNNCTRVNLYDVFLDPKKEIRNIEKDYQKLLNSINSHTKYIIEDINNVIKRVNILKTLNVNDCHHHVTVLSWDVQSCLDVFEYLKQDLKELKEIVEK